MGCGRVLLCILLPPLAVLDYGCGSIVITTILTLCGWIPGALAALIICQNPPRPGQNVGAQKAQKSGEGDGTPA